MSAAESLGSHQLNSFPAFLEEKLHTSSENSIVQIPQLKKMANEKRPQKGGKKPEVICVLRRFFNKNKFEEFDQMSLEEFH